MGSSIPDNVKIGDFPEYYEDDLHFFKYIIDLTFKRNWITKFIDDLNVELVDANDYKWNIGKSICSFYKLNGEYDFQIIIKKGMWVRKIIYRYGSSTVMFFITSNEYKRLYNIFNVKAEAVRMNMLFKNNIDNYKEL